jgi:outer membrane protein assembly factor BamB
MDISSFVVRYFAPGIYIYKSLKTKIKMKNHLLFNLAICALISGCLEKKRITEESVFHSNPAHTGIYRAPESEKLGKLNWKFKTGGAIFSSPVVANGIIYIGSEDSNLYAVSADAGTMVWKFRTSGAVSSSPAVYDQTVYFTSYDGYCYAADAKTGKEKWKFKTGGEKKVGAFGLWTMKPQDQYMEDLWDFFLSSPVVGESGSGPLLYFGSSDGNLYTLDAQNGNLKWKFKTNGIIHTSPALNNGTVFIGSWDTYMYALDALTGKEKWKFKTRDQPGMHLLEGIQASPVIDDSIVYFGARDGYFYALHANNGDTAWTFSADNSWVLTTAAVQDGTVYFGTSDTYMMMALDSKTGRKKYSLKASGYLYSSPAIVGHTAYYGDFSGNFYSLDLQSEGKQWQVFSTDGRKENADRILNEKGELDFSFTAGAQDLALYETSVDVMHEFYNLGSIVSSPAVSGNTVCFGSADGYIYSLERTK